MKASGGLQEVRHAGDLHIWTDTPSDAVQIEEPLPMENQFEVVYPNPLLLWQSLHL